VASGSEITIPAAIGNCHNRMGEAGRKKVEQTYTTAPIIAKRHIAFYEEMLAGAIPIFGPG
jgi:hypothetical protein